METTDRKRLFSAVQPSGILTLGNYIGAIKNWRELMSEYDCIYALADLHTLTVKQVPAELRAHSYELAALYIIKPVLYYHVIISCRAAVSFSEIIVMQCNKARF